jgi:Raf kinase inhibitor-like YbhB/YbcL family protein
MTLTVSSPAFGQQQPIPPRYTCEGEDVSPPLSWQNAPPRTQSFAVVCSDPDAPKGTWYHWAIFDIPSDITRLEEGLPKQPQIGKLRQATTDFHQCGYGGPCPPKGHGLHHYRFHVMALDVATLGLPDDADCQAVERAAAGHMLDEAVLTGTFSR